MISTPEKAETHGFLLACTVPAGTNIAHILEDLSQTCARNSDILEFDAEHLGEIECYDEAAGVVKES